MEANPLQDVLILLALSVLTVAALGRVHLPPILGYLFVGLVAGPHALGWIHDTEAIHFLGEIGVVFLLFTIGLEFSVPQFLAMRGTVLGLGGTQVALVTALGAGLAMALGLGWEAGVVFGGALALSSTAMVVKQLIEQVELQSRHGRNALGILLFQDIAVVPFLVLIPILAAAGDQPMLQPILWALAKGAAAFAVMFAVGHWVLRPLFHEVARARSGELFTLTALMVALAAAWVTNQMGLSLALGAFLAGLMLGETEYRHQVEADIRPFRDVLLGLFFITIGTRLDLFQLPELWPRVLGLLAFLVVGKGLLIIALARLAGNEKGVALRTGMVLAQGGEFGFALMALAMSHNLFEPATSQALLLAVGLSMALTPFLVRYNGVVAKWLLTGSYMRQRANREAEVAEEVTGLEGHVILCGFGRVGQNLAKFLRDEGLEYVALDLDPLRIREARDAGERVFFGDSTHRELLEAAGLERARAMVITFDEHYAAMKILARVRQTNPDIPILVRTRDDSYMERLNQAGATEVLPESLEASLMLATELLLSLDVPNDEVMRLLENARATGYRNLRGVFASTEPAELEQGNSARLHSVILPAEAYGVGRSLEELGLIHGDVQVTAIRRGGVRGEDPAPELELRSGDALVLQGTPEQIEWAEKRLLSG
ncbi:monovalent cation:proton antiporter-2 (CPA2) family protein [Thiohalorhabdus sp.]|uniref:monovalent cation:proton antiporter-2 (CPA2) family protein n=1 Tax=Thiohalorhabdus sp. TaxID=3094134 RepID=UPI002FC282E7